jgi:hypothetical protein
VSRRTSPQKAERILRFLLAIHDEYLAGILVAHGFGARDLAEGWRYLRALGPSSLAHARAPEKNVERLAAEGVRRWAARWLRVARVALARRFPAAAKKLFAVPVAGDVHSILAVSSFLDRLRALERRPEGRAVREHLVTRGLDDEVLAEARGLVARAQGLELEAETKRAKGSGERDDAAERDAWTWYIEWTTIVRVSVRDGRLLRRLGFGRPGRPRGKVKKEDA